MEPLKLIKQGLFGVKSFVNNCFENKEPWQIVSLTATSIVMSVWLWEFVFQEESLMARGKKTVFRLARKVPAIAQKIDSEMKKINDTFEKEVIHRNKDNPYITVLPEKGKECKDIINHVDHYLSSVDL